MSVKALSEQKMVKLAEQKALSDTMNKLLVDHLNPSSKEVKRNLTAAIAQSKSPGYFQYFVQPDEVKQAEQQKTLNGMARNISKVHNEIEQLDNEIALAAASTKGRTPEDQQLASVNEWFAKNGGRTFGEGSSSPTSLKNWFETYGKPDVSGTFAAAMLSKLEPNPKIYGGTAHHRSFKSKAVIMKKGSLTR